MATILITGGTGLVGTRLTEMLAGGGYDVVILTRNPANINENRAGVRYAEWDLEKQTIDRKAIETADHVIHLAGAGVADKRWNEKRKQEIVNSRTQSSALLVRALREIPNNVETVVTASAIGWYGADTKTSRKEGFAETAPADEAFLGQTCRLWEESIEPVTMLGKRLVTLRTGIVLSSAGGALQEFVKPLKFGVATILGDGKQVISWIQVDDLCRMYLWAIENKQVSGVYNAVAPAPVTNKQLTLALAEKLRGKYYVPLHVPSFVLKIVMGEMSIEVLKSATVSSSQIEATGFKFLYPDILSALEISL